MPAKLVGCLAHAVQVLCHDSKKNSSGIFVPADASGFWSAVCETVNGGMGINY